MTDLTGTRISARIRGSLSTLHPLVTHFLGTMRPGHDGVTRVAYRLRELFSGEVRHSYVSPLVPHPLPPDMRMVPSVPFPFSTNYRLATISARGVSRRLSDELPSLVHVHSPCTLGRAALGYAKEFGIPAVATYHTHFPSYLRYYKLGLLEAPVWTYLRSLYGRCAAVIVPSRTTLRDLERAGLRNLVHIPHGVEVAKFSPARRSVEWRRRAGGEGKVIVTFVGRLVWEKNLRLLAQAWHRMEAAAEAQLVIVGDGPARASLERLLPRAHFTGQLSDLPLTTAYASSDVFAFPSVTETFGNVVVEAMASALPVVCANAGGSADFVQNGRNGLLVSGHDASELARALDTMVRSEALRARCAENAQRTAALYSWPSVARRYEALYRDVMLGASAAPSASSHFAPVQVNGHSEA